MSVQITRRFLAAAVVVGTLAWGSAAQAHCDSPEGPVIPAVQKALDTKDLTPALRWIKPEQEPEVKAAFEKAQRVRGQGGDAKELADRYFVETFVRLHRAGEGEPYTGIKPAGTDPGAAVKTADAALKSGDDDALVKLVSEAVGRAVHERFAKARELQAHADHSVDAGREYVSAYVGLVHFVEHVYGLAESPAQAEHGHGTAGEHEGH